MKKTNGTIAFFYVDPWVDAYEWIIANKGKIIKKFIFNNGKLDENFGNPICQAETDFLNFRKKESEKG